MTTAQKLMFGFGLVALLIGGNVLAVRSAREGERYARRLGGIMLLSARFHIPETITGLIGATLIGISLWWSVRHNRRAPDPEEALGD